MRIEKTDDYRDWIDELKDLSARARIGGDKSTQSKDIAKAIRLAQAYGE
jgi:putative component of toxin-antitoxin plasmid stabilization module